MGIKRKRQESQEERWFRDAKNGKPKFFLGFSVKEIDKIMEERLPRNWNLICSRKRRRLSDDITSLVGNDDLISKLPGDILCSIMSFMTLREAAITSMLSRSWRSLWRTSSNLDFDAINMSGDDIDFHEFPLHDTTLQKQQKRRFVGWVNQILELHCGEKIESFRVEYPLGRDYGRDIDQWIRFAVNKEVQKLDISLLVRDLFCRDHELYRFPYWLFAQVGRGSTLKHLSLNTCTFSLPPNFSAFNSLTSLTLKNTCLNEENVVNILASCLCLQLFSMARCFCPVRLKFSGGRPFLKLKHLSLNACGNLKEIEIHDAVSLASFEYGGDMLSRLSFKNSAQPVRVCFNVGMPPLASYTYALGGLATDFPRVETLLLASWNIKVDMIPKRLPTFAKLKHLVLLLLSGSRSLLEMASSFLWAAPFLVKLELCLPGSSTVTTNIVKKKIPLEEYCRHQHLKEVELYNFHGHKNEVDLAVYLLNNAVVLEKMRIVCKDRIYKGDGEWLIPHRENKVRRKQACEILCAEAPSTTKLIVV